MRDWWVSDALTMKTYSLICWHSGWEVNTSHILTATGEIILGNLYFVARLDLQVPVVFTPIHLDDEVMVYARSVVKRWWKWPPITQYSKNRNCPLPLYLVDSDVFSSDGIILTRFLCLSPLRPERKHQFFLAVTMMHPFQKEQCVKHRLKWKSGCNLSYYPNNLISPLDCSLWHPVRSLCLHLSWLKCSPPVQERWITVWTKLHFSVQTQPETESVLVFHVQIWYSWVCAVLFFCSHQFNFNINHRFN